MQISDIRTKLLLYLTALCVVANSACMWEHTTTSLFYGARFGAIFLALCVIQIIINEEFIITKNRAIALTVLCTVFFVYGLVTKYDIKVYATTYVLVFVTMFFYAASLYKNNQLRQLFETYSNVIVVIAVISLFFWVFGSLLKVIPGKELQYYWADNYKLTYSWWGLYYENPTQNIGQPTVRNLGVFAEAPGFSGQLLYALLIEISFVLEKNQNRYISSLVRDKRFFRAILLSITMLSTLSTKGLIGLMLIWAFVLLSLRCQTKEQLALKAGTIICGLCVTIVISSILISQKMGTGSGMMRMDDMSAAIKVWIDHPFFGVGYINSDPIYQYQTVVRDNGGLSMGFVLLLAWGGLCFFSIYFIAAIRVRRTFFFRNNKLIWLMVVTALTYNLFISNCGFSNVYIFLVASAYAVPVESQFRLQASRKLIIHS